ncbi:MAG: pirin family protein [Tissierellia bacterium]|nr:pirin family protein [Tissierellia bacterium]
MTKQIISINDFNFREEVNDPFIIRMHHIDYYPKGNGNMGVPESDLTGKNIGDDFDLESDFKMYYGKDVPGFPVHPHRGFETVTFVLQGFVDHSDSHGASGRYGAGDVQWMTAGQGMQHAEMFPLINDDKENTLELFQIWLNLPPESKFVEPSYKMLWAEHVPVIKETDEAGNTATITLVAGSYNGVNSLKPTPDSWANNPDNHVGIWKSTLNPMLVLFYLALALH